MMVDRAMINRCRFRNSLTRHPDAAARLVASFRHGRVAAAAVFNSLWRQAQWVSAELEALPTPPTRH